MSEIAYSTGRESLERSLIKNMLWYLPRKLSKYCYFWRMKDKVVVITGGSSGIGRALAFEFGSRGSKIVITGRNHDAVSATCSELIARGIAAHAIVADVTQPDDNKMMAEETIRIFGQIDVLINNAGVSMRAMFEDVDLDVITTVMNINFYGAVYATKYCLPYIMQSKGSVIGISSIAGFRGLPARTGYSASKFALNGFLEALRTELLNSGVHVLTACPGFTASNIRKRSLMQDGSSQGESPRVEEKMMSAEECARHIYRATVKRKRTLVLTFQGKLVVFLNKWLGSFTDRMVYNVMKKEARSPLR